MKNYNNKLKETMYSLDHEMQVLEDRICKEHLSIGQLIKMQDRLDYLNNEIYKIQKTLNY